MILGFYFFKFYFSWIERSFAVDKCVNRALCSHTPRQRPPDLSGGGLFMHSRVYVFMDASSLDV